MTDRPAYSADVALWLEFSNNRLELSHVASDTVIARLPADAMLCISIDGEVQRENVKLTRVDGHTTEYTRPRISYERKGET